MCAVNMENERKWRISMHELNDHKSIISIKDAGEEGDYFQWSIQSAGIAFTRNLALPPSIINKTPDKNMKFNNIVFRCGGNNYLGSSTDYCGALLFDSQQFQKASNDMIHAYNWELPELLENSFYATFPVFSTQTSELYAVHKNKIWTLSFNNDAYLNQTKEWNWEQLDIEPYCDQPSAAMIRNKRLFIIPGDDTKPKQMGIYDFNYNTWIKGQNRIYGSQFCGIYYNEIDDIVYVGGGYQDEQDIERALPYMEYYDLEQDIWAKLPDANKEHDMYPLIWMQDNQLLHMMSISSNCIEFIDLREGNRWEVKNNYDLT